MTSCQTVTTRTNRRARERHFQPLVRGAPGVVASPRVEGNHISARGVTMSERTSPIPIPPPPEGSRGFPIWPLIVFGVLGAMVLLIAGVGAVASFFYVWQMDFEGSEEFRELYAEMRDELREQGYPVSGEELNEWYPPVEGPNAAEEYYAAIDALGDTDEAAQRTNVFLELRNNYSYDAPPQDLVDDLREALSHYASSQEHLLATLDIEQARFDVDFTVMAKIERKHIRHYSLIMRLVHMSADEAAARGAVNEAADWILCGLRITSIINEVPLMWTFVRTHSERIEVIQTLRRTLSHRAFEREDLERLQAAFEAIDSVEYGRRALIGQRAYGMSTLDAHYGEPPGSLRAVCMLEFYEMALDDLADELPERNSFETLGEFGGPSAPSFLMLSEAHRLLFRIKSDMAFVRLAVAVLAIERFRADHGRVPETLDELVGEYLEAVPIDPFDGQPIRYGLHSSAYFVYSVWADGEDGGGEMQALDRTEKAVGDQILYISRGLN